MVGVAGLIGSPPLDTPRSRARSGAAPAFTIRSTARLDTVAPVIASTSFAAFGVESSFTPLSGASGEASLPRNRAENGAVPILSPSPGVSLFSSTRSARIRFAFASQPKIRRIVSA